MTTKPRREKHVTPSGTFVYPRLSAPDFKYKAEHGEYSTKLKLTAAEAAPIIKLIQDATEADYKAQCASQGKVKIKRSANVPFKLEEDDQGVETGNVLFSFKLAGAFKDRKTGEIVKLSPQVFDKFGSPVTDEIWGGSVGKVCFELNPYFTDGIGHGMGLRLKAVRIEKLVTKGMGGAEMYGFEVEEPNEEPMTVDEVAKAEGAPSVTKTATSGDF